MDLWVVALTTGAGCLIKYLKKSSETGDSSCHLSSEDSNFEKAESFSWPLTSLKQPRRREIGKDVCLDRRGLDWNSSDVSSLDGSLTEDVASDRGFNCEKLRQFRNYNESDLLSISNLAVPLSPYDDNFKDGEDGNERNTDIFGNHGFFLPDYSSNVVPIHNSFGNKTFLSTKRFPEHVKRPLNSLESCFMAQLYKEHAKMAEYVFSPLSSQSTATRSFHVSNGSRILNRESDTLTSALTGSREHKLHKAGREQDKNVVRGVPSLPKTGSLNDTKKMKPDAVNGRSRRSSFSDDVFSGKLTGYDPTFVFSLGISLGIITCTMANKKEINKLRELLKQNENLVEDLQDELDMKDSMTVKELHNENYGSQDTCDHSFSGKELHEFSPEKHVDSSPRIDCKESYDKKEEQSSESMSKIEAELEAELERLGLDMNVSSLDRKLSELVEIDPEFVADFAQGELRADTVSGTDANVTTPLPANYAVSPHELSLRLHEVVKNQLEERVKELEIALENSQRRVRFLESEHDRSFEKASSPNKGNISMTHDEDCDAMSQPLILNLSGEALDAYNEAYEELITMNDSEDNSPPTNIHDSDDNKEGSLSHDCNATVFEHSSATYSVVDEGSLSREPYFSKETMLEEESSSDLNVSGDESCDFDNDEMERQLIRQIVERTKKGSPLYQNAKKILYSMGEDEQH
ncbi:protein POLAR LOCALIZATION DURING ASYMMETRIC DIVISION AND REDISTRIBUTION [Trifolium repens]|nr:protein POLAR LOCALIZATION DURING ASYMMETRIC DIVISION AND REDISTRIBUTION [Trifolium repens]KAK2387774.1 protein POLAR LOCALIZATION DURING ASYMMETRIC DIVISION AND REDISTRIBUTION [Trifolium repens]